MYHKEIKQKALELGFIACGISKAEELTNSKAKLSTWLQKDFHCSMQWMENHFEKRVNPAKLVEGSRSVITVLLNYFPNETQPSNVPQIAKYAYGKDYHFVIKEKLKELLEFINNELTPTEGRFFTDSAPILERDLAVKAGLGWIGKNSMLITKTHGSFVLIGELIIDLELPYDTPFERSHCGNCTRCIDACPTGAIVSPGTIDSTKCLSFWTIEHKGNFNENTPDSLHNRAFGCDICQDICPWNNRSTPHTLKELQPHPNFLKLNENDWHNLSANEFSKLFKKSPLKRTKYSGIMRNLDKIRKERDTL